MKINAEPYKNSSARLSVKRSVTQFRSKSAIPSMSKSVRL